MSDNIRQTRRHRGIQTFQSVGSTIIAKKCKLKSDKLFRNNFARLQKEVKKKKKEKIKEKEKERLKNLDLI